MTRISDKAEKGLYSVALLQLLTTYVIPHEAPQHNGPYLFSPGREGTGIAHFKGSFRVKFPQYCCFT